MARLREWAVAWLTRAFVWTTVRVAPRPPVPPEKRFHVEQDGPRADLTAYLLFCPGAVPRGDWHVAYLLCFDSGHTIIVDSLIGRCWVHPMPHKPSLERVVSLLKAEYVVTVRTASAGCMYHDSIGPTTCITLAKRLLGVHNPGMVTSRQLLDYLWRRR
ncbi:MAG: hypothetical protein EA406_02230 [Rhodospirillales bacterium]|nr:MAG: hypothetical protein EA406_02230 [Rhodospirillales bacterium]